MMPKVNEGFGHGQLVAQLDDLCIDIWISVMIITTQITERRGTIDDPDDPDDLDDPDDHGDC